MNICDKCQEEAYNYALINGYLYCEDCLADMSPRDIAELAGGQYIEEEEKPRDYYAEIGINRNEF